MKQNRKHNTNETGVVDTNSLSPKSSFTLPSGTDLSEALRHIAKLGPAEVVLPDEEISEIIRTEMFISEWHYPDDTESVQTQAVIWVRLTWVPEAEFAIRMKWYGSTHLTADGVTEVAETLFGSHQVYRHTRETVRKDDAGNEVATNLRWTFLLEELAIAPDGLSKGQPVKTELIGERWASASGYFSDAEGSTTCSEASRALLSFASLYAHHQASVNGITNDER